MSGFGASSVLLRQADGSALHVEGEGEMLLGSVHLPKVVVCSAVGKKYSICVKINR